MIMYKVIVQKPALLDIINLRHYMKHNNYSSMSAKHQLHLIWGNVESLAELPRMNPTLHERFGLNLNSSFRLKISKYYYYVYRIHQHEHKIHVLRILNQRQNTKAKIMNFFKLLDFLN